MSISALCETWKFAEFTNKNKMLNLKIQKKKKKKKKNGRVILIMQNEVEICTK